MILKDGEEEVVVVAQYQLRNTNEKPTQINPDSKRETPKTNPISSGESYWVDLARALGKDVSIENAKRFYEDVKKVLPVAKRCGKKTILNAIKRCHKVDGQIPLDRLEMELRKKRYGYNGNPDHIQVVSIPMGGKPSR